MPAWRRGQVGVFKRPAPSGQTPDPVKRVQVGGREIATPSAPRLDGLGDSGDPWKLVSSELTGTASKVVVMCSDFFVFDGGPAASTVAVMGDDGREVGEHAESVGAGPTDCRALVALHQATPGATPRGRSNEGGPGEIETIERRRQDAPPVVKRRPRGSLVAAMRIAGSSALKLKALSNLKTLTYAPTTLCSKNAKFSLWCRIARGHGLAPLPLTVHLVEVMAATLRAAGYVSGFAYILEAKQRHIRGHSTFGSIGPDVELACTDAKRAIARSRGPATRSAEVRPEAWDALPAGCPSWREPGHPAAGPELWGFGTGFMVREIELATFTLASVAVDRDLSRITVRFEATKTSTTGRPVFRTYACHCGRRDLPSCAACAGRLLVESAERRSGVLRDEPGAEKVPLIGTCRDPFQVVKKVDIVMAARADAAHLQDALGNPLKLEGPGGGTLGGHFMRRSGAKALARAGQSIASIQHAGRWGSLAVMAYVEEAREEFLPAQVIPAQPARPERHWKGVKGAITHALRTSALPCSSAEDFIKALTDRVPDRELLIKEAVGTDDALAKLSCMVKELADTVFPRYVTSRDGKRQAACARVCSQFRGPPSDWTTVCGWHWVTAARACRQSAQLPPDAELCKKCVEISEGMKLAGRED